MTTAWYTPRDEQQARPVAVAMIVIASLSLFITGSIEIVQLQTVTWLPTEQAPNSNVLLTFITPVILGLICVVILRGESRMFSYVVLTMCCLSVFYSAWANLQSRDTSIGAACFYLLPTIAVAYLWRAPVVYTQVAFTCAAVMINFLVLDSLQLALTKWLGFCVVLIGGVAAIVAARDAQDRVCSILETSTLTDPLTKLATRRRLDTVINATPPTLPSAMILIDIDYFKRVNDTHGHPFGDVVLGHVADAMRRRLPDGASAYRLGGDEMGIFVPDCTPHLAYDTALGLSEDISALQLTTQHGQVVPVTTSIGVAHTPKHTPSVHTLYSVSDAALYDAKRAGRNRVCLARATSALGGA